MKELRTDLTRNVETKFYELRLEVDMLRKEIEGLRTSLGDTSVTPSRKFPLPIFRNTKNISMDESPRKEIGFIKKVKILI